jgi:hypothetical protein|tara:strand:- start:123 stop:419 length:297 start_codon:yes stop_codon:yes gene_type:complete
MSYGKKRLRGMGPEQRAQAKLANELQSVLTKWKNRIERMGELELDARALANGHKLHGPNVRIVAGKTEDYWPTPLCVKCQTPISEGRWVRAASEQAHD